MKAKLAFGVSMAFNFEYYLIDEVMAVGDSSFRKKSEEFFAQRRKKATLIVVSHNMRTVNSLCDALLVLHQGKLHEFDTREEAVRFYTESCAAAVTQ